MKNSRTKLPLVIILLILLAMVGGCGVEEMYSAWCDRRVTIDGLDDGTEWKNALHLVAKGEITVGLLNDERMLYLRVSTRNQAIQRQITRAGLTVWFDETGGKKQIYGINFPLPVPSREPGAERMPAWGKEGRERMDFGDRPDPFTEISQGDIEIFRPEENLHSTISADHTDDRPLTGIRCRIGNTKGVLVYELRVPLIRDENSYHGIAANKPKIIGIGLVSGKDEPMRYDIGDIGGGRGGGHEGRGGRPSSGGGDADRSGEPPQGPSGRGGNQDNFKLDQWLKVHLSDRP